MTALISIFIYPTYPTISPKDCCRDNFSNDGFDTHIYLPNLSNTSHKQPRRLPSNEFHRQNSLSALGPSQHKQILSIDAGQGRREWGARFDWNWRALSISPILRILSSPSRATWIILLSIMVKTSQRGLMQPWDTRYLICGGSCNPPGVAFEMAQQASFFVLASSLAWILIRGGTILASITALR